MENKLMLHKQNLTLYFFALFLCTVQFSAASWFVKITPIPLTALLVLSMACFLSFSYVTEKKYLREQDKTLNRFIIFFLLMIFISIVSSLYTLSVINSVEYVSYIKSSLPTRLIYYFTYLTFLFTGYYVLRDKEDQKVIRVLKFYPLSILLLVVVGVWQLLHFTIGVPFLGLNTRSYIHSVTGTVLFDFRLTSFLDEPSYLGPILIDLLIIGVFLFKQKWKYVIFIVIPSITVLLFSFSVSGYINLLVILLLVTFLYITMSNVQWRSIFKYLIGIIGFFAIILFVFNDVVLEFFSPILARGDSLFDIESSSRMYMYVMPIFWLFDHSIISALFGYGPGSFDFLSLSKTLPSMGSVSTSSNNMFIDLLFECGIVGLIVIITIIMTVFKKLFKKYSWNIYSFIAFVEFTHLILSSLYRADFATPRFWTLLLIIFLLDKIGSDKGNLNTLRRG